MKFTKKIKSPSLGCDFLDLWSHRSSVLEVLTLNTVGFIIYNLQPSQSEIEVTAHPLNVLRDINTKGQR